MMQGTKHKAQIGLSNNDARYKALDIWCKQLHVCKDPNIHVCKDQNREEEEEEIGLSDNDARYKARHMMQTAPRLQRSK